jgi:hypothetical protein
MRRIVREGFVAGLIGAVAVAVWFLIVDTINGRPFFTPAMLGSAAFWGVLDPGLASTLFSTDPERVFAAVVGYTMLHVVGFIIVGMIAAALAYEVELFPSTFFVVVVFFAIFEFGFYILVAVLAQPLLGALAWWNVAIGNAIAALGMGYYLWAKHPKLREQLARHPLGQPIDEADEAPVDTSGGRRP